MDRDPSLHAEARTQIINAFAVQHLCRMGLSRTVGVEDLRVFPLLSALFYEGQRPSQRQTRRLPVEDECIFS